MDQSCYCINRGQLARSVFEQLGLPYQLLQPFLKKEDMITVIHARVHVLYMGLPLETARKLQRSECGRSYADGHRQSHIKGVALVPSTLFAHVKDLALTYKTLYVLGPGPYYPIRATRPKPRGLQGLGA